MILAGRQLPRFSQETIQAVYNASRNLGYHRKQNHKQEDIVVIVCPSVINPYFATLLQGMESEAEANGCNTVVFNTYWSTDREKRILDISSNPLVKGIIFAMAPQQPELVKIAAGRIPIVTVSDKQFQTGLDTVEVDNFDAGYQIGEHLIGLGHTDVCYLSTSMNTQHSSRLLRYHGLVESFKKLCPSGSVSLIIHDVESSKELDTVEIEHQVGMELARKCIASTTNVTAMVAINDMVAYGVIDEVLAEGLSIPGDYSVCGFDNIYPSQFHGVALTTIDHHINQRGRKAFSLLKAKLERTGVEDSITHVEFTNLLVVRATTGAPRKQDRNGKPV